MAIAYVQSRSVDSGTTTAGTLAFLSNTTAGSLLVVAIRQGGAGTCTITDSQGNSYTNPINFTFGAQKLYISYALNTVGGANTVTCTFGASASMRFAIHEYSGVASASAIDQSTAASTGSSNTTPDSGNVTTTVADELLFGAAAVEATATFTAGTNYTLRQQIPAAANGKLATEDRIVTSTGTYSASFSLDASTLNACGIVTFKQAVTTGPIFKFAGIGGGFAGEKIGFAG